MAGDDPDPQESDLGAYELRVAAVTVSTASTTIVTAVITELAVEATRLDGADRGGCLRKGQVEEDTWKVKGGSMGAKDHEPQEGGSRQQ